MVLVGRAGTGECQALGSLREPLHLAAIRYRHPWYGAAATWRQEGRYAVLAADTTGAIRAFRRTLEMLREAEPAVIPERDSVRAELARLEGSR